MDLPASGRPEREDEPWIRSGNKIAARLIPGGVMFVLEGITTQAKVYKPLVKEFCRKSLTMVRPRWGDVHVHIVMSHLGEPPHVDLDNLAKALLDSVIGTVIFDDSQVSRLLVERLPASADQISLIIEHQ